MSTLERGSEPKECLICALWRVGSWFAEAANEAVFHRLSNECSTLYSILPIWARQINQNMMSTSKWIANAFSLKYQLETDSIRSASAYSASGWIQLGAPLWHIHICMLTGAHLTSFAASFKCERGFKLGPDECAQLKCGSNKHNRSEYSFVRTRIKHASSMNVAMKRR